MILLRREDHHMVFFISPREKTALLALLDLYPLVPVSHQSPERLGDSPRLAESRQLLLESAQFMQEQHRSWMEKHWFSGTRFQTSGSGFVFEASPDDAERLLQILNDIRVGSWMALGSPDISALRQTPGAQEISSNFLHMELAGYFQTGILQSFQSSPDQTPNPGN